MKKFLDAVKNNPFLRSFIRFYQAAESDITSIAVAYYLLISVFPLLLIAANILPYFQISPKQILLTLNTVLPDTLYRTVATMVENVLTRPSTGFLSFSIVSALWIFSQSIAYLQRAFNKAYGVEKERGVIWSRIFSFLVSFALQAVFAFSLLFSMFSRMFVRLLYRWWQFDNQLYQQLLNITEPTVYLLLFLSLVLLYYTLPNIRIGKIRYVLPGALFTITVLYSILNIFWKYIDRYMTHFLDARFFGSVLLAVIMFWFILVARIIIIGAILNASVEYTFTHRFQKRNGEVVQLVGDALQKEEKHLLRFKRSLKK